MLILNTSPDSRSKTYILVLHISLFIMSHRFKHLLLFATRFTCLCSCLLIVRLTSWQWSYLRRIRTRSLSWLAFEEQKQTRPAFHPHLRLFGSSGEEQQASAPPLCLRCAPLRACRFDDICEVKEPVIKDHWSGV